MLFISSFTELHIQQQYDCLSDSINPKCNNFTLMQVISFKQKSLTEACIKPLSTFVRLISDLDYYNKACD